MRAQNDQPLRVGALIACLLLPHVTQAQTYVYRTTPHGIPFTFSETEAGEETGPETSTTADCYAPENIGQVAPAGWSGCGGMLIVDNAMLSGASAAFVGGDASFAIAGPDGNTYTFADSAFNIFTGQVTSLASLFYRTSFNGDIGYWDTSNVTTMFGLFRENSAFNQPIEGWGTSNVTMMNSMFRAATAFNRDLSGWCVSNIPSNPNFFDTIASSWSLPRPQWGTCPGG